MFQNTTRQSTLLLPIILLASLLVLCLASPAGAAAPRTLGSVKQAATGGPNTCVIKKDDRVRCWGAEMDVPGDLGAVKQIALGYPSGLDSWSYACAIKSDDRVGCWSSGFQCIPAFGATDCDTNIEDPTAADLGTVKKLSLGAMVSCGLGLDDHVRCSDGSADPQATPDAAAEVPAEVASSGTAVDVATGEADIACAVKSNGATLCWGDDTDGNDLTALPSALQSPGSSKKVFVGRTVACVILQDDRVQCWGSGTEDLKVPSSLGAVKDLSLSSAGACAIRQDNRVQCWGPPFPGASPAQTPIAVRVMSDVTGVSIGAASACVVQQTGKLTCWGSDHSGQLSGRPVSARRMVGMAYGWDPQVGCDGKTDYDPRGNMFWRDVAAISTAFDDGSRECQYVRPWMSHGRLSVSRQAFQWGSNPSSVVYLWQRAKRVGRGSKAHPGSFANLPQATSSSYLIGRADKGHYIRACAIAQNQDGASPLTCSLPRGPFR